MIVLAITLAVTTTRTTASIAAGTTDPMNASRRSSHINRIYLLVRRQIPVVDPSFSALITCGCCSAHLVVAARRAIWESFCRNSPSPADKLRYRHRGT